MSSLERRIWKYQLPHESKFSLKMGTGKILSVQNQDGHVVLWLETVPALGEVSRDFRIVMTGEEFDREESEAWEYLGTVQVGAIVVHVYEIFPF